MQQVVVYWQSIIPQHVSGVFTPIIRRADCMLLPTVSCPGCSSLPDSPEVQQLQPGQETIGSNTQSDLLTMGVKAPETC
jgi:hypothetical protein